jgi:hypothetical protein
LGKNNRGKFSGYVSVKTQYAREERGVDGGKKVKGHKRHIVVDILGNLLYVRVHPTFRTPPGKKSIKLRASITQFGNRH